MIKCTKINGKSEAKNSKKINEIITENLLSLTK